MSDLGLEGTYSYADYLTWCFEQSAELIKGKVFKMSPAPSVKHQKLSRELLRIFLNYFKKGSPCDLFTAPLDVRLLDKKKPSRAHADVCRVVQPDICVICDKDKLDEQGCIGTPDLEIDLAAVFVD